MTKCCPKCKKDFECNADDIQQCACAHVKINTSALTEIRQKYSDCLCVNCLKSIDNTKSNPKNTYSILLLLIFVFGCSEVAPKADPKIPKKPMDIKLVSSISFRKTYATCMSIEDSVQYEACYEEAQKSLPGQTFISDTLHSTSANFEHIGVSKAGTMILKMQDDAIDMDSFGLQMIIMDSVYRLNDQLTLGLFQHEGDFSVCLTKGKDTAWLNELSGPLLHASFKEIKFTNGNSGLLFSSEWYVGNGYNYDFYIYELKSTTP